MPFFPKNWKILHITGKDIGGQLQRFFPESLFPWKFFPAKVYSLKVSPLQDQWVFLKFFRAFVLRKYLEILRFYVRNFDFDFSILNLEFWITIHFSLDSWKQYDVFPCILVAAVKCYDAWWEEWITVRALWSDIEGHICIEGAQQDYPFVCWLLLLFISSRWRCKNFMMLVQC